GTTLQGRLTLVRYNNEPQFFIADADVLLTMAADVLERLGAHLDPEMVDSDLVNRLREGVELVERRAKARGGRPRSSRRLAGAFWRRPGRTGERPPPRGSSSPASCARAV